MTPLVLLVFATMIAGCVSVPKQGTTLSRQYSKAEFRNMPSILHPAVISAVEAMTPQSERDTTAATESAAFQQTLFNALLQTDIPLLRSDDAFERLHLIVVGENTQPRLAYAAALADYLTQPEFRCRQPVFGRYFQHRYADNRIAAPCPPEVSFSVTTNSDSSNIVWIDPKRVKAIHLLFAAKNGNAASRYGHIALRLVVCPEGQTTSKACDANLYEHLVIGFRAHIDELSLSMLKALSGDYKAYLFANQFMDVYEEYAIDEFREIYSVPLRLDDTQRELMVRELAEIHWRYAGNYNFFIRNCATLLQASLRQLWPEFNSVIATDYVRPDHLFDAVKSSSLADGSKLTTLDVAEREGNYFSSTKRFYDQAIREVSRAMLKPAFTNIESYLEIDPKYRQQAFTADTQFFQHLATDKHLHEAQIMLEEFAVLRSMRMLMIEGAQYLEQQNFMKNSDRIHAQLDAEHTKIFDDCLLEPIRQQTRPLKRLTALPSKSDLQETSGQNTMCHSARSNKLLQEAIAEIKDAKSEQWQRLKAISLYWTASLDNLNLLNLLHHGTKSTEHTRGTHESQ